MPFAMRSPHQIANSTVTSENSSSTSWYTPAMRPAEGRMLRYSATAARILSTLLTNGWGAR